MRSLLEDASPAVLTTYRQDDSAHTVPAWFRWNDEAFEVVTAKGDMKLRRPGVLLQLMSIQREQPRSVWSRPGRRRASVS
jgi:hypothetical protein